METVKVKASGGKVFLGQQHDNLVRDIIFPIRADLADEEWSLAHQRATDTEPYPVPVEVAGTNVIWHVTSGDTDISGAGRAQLVCSGSNGEQLYSAVYTTVTVKSLSDNITDPPAPVKPWYDDIMDKIDQMGGGGGVTIDQTLSEEGKAADAKAVGDALKGKQPTGDYALKKDIPTVPSNVSAFANDAGYLTNHQSLEGYAKTTDIPNTLPSPKALTFTGAVEGSYDGSEALTVNIPSGSSGGSGGTDIALGMTGAEVGQIAKITAVDEDGKPTAWEPVALPDEWEHVCDIAVSGDDELSYFTQEFDATYKKLIIVRDGTAIAPTTGTNAGGNYWTASTSKYANNNDQYFVWMFTNDTWVTNVIEAEIICPYVVLSKAYTSYYGHGFQCKILRSGNLPTKGFTSTKIGANKLFNDGTFRIYGVRA